MSVQGDHIHIIVRTTRKSRLQNFMRVFAGQIAQQFEEQGLANFFVTDTPARGRSRKPTLRKIKLWKHRPFTRVVFGRRALITLEDYVQLNELEALGIIPYRKERLRGLKEHERRILWNGVEYRRRTRGDRYPDQRARAGP